MTPRDCMINVMADLIGLDETYKGDRLNDPGMGSLHGRAVQTHGSDRRQRHIGIVEQYRHRRISMLDRRSRILVGHTKTKSTVA
jgi:hypothetical protein